MRKTGFYMVMIVHIKSVWRTLLLTCCLLPTALPAAQD